MNWNIYGPPNPYLGCPKLLGHVEAETAELAQTEAQKQWGDRVYRMNSMQEVVYVDQPVRCDGGQPLIE